jgi:hypothetical protein
MWSVFEAGGPWLLFMAFLCLSALSASDEVSYTTGGVSSHWTPQGWTHTESYADIRNYADRPDEQTLAALSIEWRELELDRLGNMCAIRGRVMMADGAKRTKPINWFQGVAIYLGMAPNARPDWSRGVNQTDTLATTAVTNPDGRFQASIDMRESKYDRDQAQSFQLGVALAKHTAENKTSQKVVWSSRTPAIPSSVKMLSVPRAPPLSHELRLINRASGWPLTNPNGVDLIRAANALQPLGKERALAVLEQYADLTYSLAYHADQDIVFWIIRLLFEPIRLGERIPQPAVAVVLDERELPAAMKWPLAPLAVHADVPFMIGGPIFLDGVPEQPWSHIEWARLHGAIRDEPLAPTANPLAAAEAILRSRRFKALDKGSRDQATGQLQSQALAMVKGLVPPMDERKENNDEHWRSCLKTAAARGIHWDAKRERFVTAEGRGE